MRRGRLLLLALCALVVLPAGGALIIRLGVYNIAATEMHTRPLLFVLTQTKLWSIRQRAEEIRVPDLSEPASIERGRQHYQDHCLACHGAPGVARHDLGKGATPLPPNLVQTAREWRPAEIFWVVKYGLKSTGMPGWDYRMPDPDLWAITAFVVQLPQVSPAEFRARFGRQREDRPPQRASPEVPAGDAKRGEIAIRQHACPACHRIPGIVGPDANVGAPLRHMARRQYIAGVLLNSQANMIRWLIDPTEVDPLTAMPDLGVSRAHASDIAAYLATLD